MNVNGLSCHVAIVGGGPAGLMAAQIVSAAGVRVDLYEAKGSVGRKLLIAGRGGLNLTHSEEQHRFRARYGAHADRVATWLERFDSAAARAWAQDLGIETFVGTSGRVFPSDMKAAPLLRNWVRRLREQGVRFHVKHECRGFTADRRLLLATPSGEQHTEASAIVLALGGASWPQLGSTGAWVQWLGAHGVAIEALRPANCGFDVAWSEVFASRFAGEPVKSTIVSDGQTSLQGEFVITQNGIEGSAIYALSAGLRDTIAAQGSASVQLDLLPGQSLDALLQAISRPRKGRTLTEHLRRTIGLAGVKLGLLYEALPKRSQSDSALLAKLIKSLPLVLQRPRPIAEAISTAGGVNLDELDAALMLRRLPGVFCAGEMLDWEAPTGGYLLTACMASGVCAAQGVLQWLRETK